MQQSGQKTVNTIISRAATFRKLKKEKNKKKREEEEE